MKYALMFNFAERLQGNAAMTYADAVMLLKPDSNDTAEKALDALAANDEAGFAKAADSIDLPALFDQLDVAGRRDRCDWDSPLRDRGVLTLLPHLNPLTHGVSKVIRVRATRQVMQGKVDEALATMRLGYELADKLGQEQVIVSALVSVGQFSWMNEPLARLMSRPESPNLYWALRELPPRWPILRRAWDAEFGWIYVCVPTLAKARAGERLSAAQWHKAMYDEVAPFFLNYENYYPKGTRPHPDPVKDAGADVLRMAREQFAATHKVSAEQAANEDPTVVIGEFYYRSFETAHDDLGKLRGLSYPEILPRARAVNVDQIAKLKKEQPANPFLEGVTGMYRAIDRFARADRQLAALITVEAIRSYAAANGGKLPSKLDDMIDTPVPLNPITGKAFEYEVKGGEATLKDSASETPLTYTITIRK
jgi:hypothetical protein